MLLAAFVFREVFSYKAYKFAPRGDLPQGDADEEEARRRLVPDPRNRRAGRGIPGPKDETVLEYAYESDSSAAVSERDSTEVVPGGGGGGGTGDVPDTPPGRKGTLIIPSHSITNPLTHRGENDSSDRTYHVI